MTPAASATEPGKVAFIGSGTMGLPMARQLLASKHQVTVFDRSAAAMGSAAESGATVSSSAAEAGLGSDIVLLSLPGPEQVEEAVTGSDGILSAASPPKMIVDLSTNSIDVVRNLRRVCQEAGVAFVDAPVSGGVAKARDGTLAVLVGATGEEYEACLGFLQCVGGDVIHVGPPGSGTIAKLVNNQLFLAAGLVVQEAYLLGGALGMEPTELHQIIKASSAAPYAKLAPLLLSRRFDDVIFRLDIAAKDLELAAETATAAGVEVPLTSQAAEVFRAAVLAGDGERVFHATLSELERRAGIELSPLTRPRQREET